MAKKNSSNGEAKFVGASLLTRKDADRFAAHAKKYTDIHTGTRSAAQKKLNALGIYGKDGKLTKKYA